MPGEHRLRRDRVPPQVARAERPGVPRWLPWAVAAATLLLLVVGAVLVRGFAGSEVANDTLTGDNTVLEQQRDATADQAVGLADPVAGLCSRGDATSAALREVGACDRAAEVQDNPIAGPAGPRGRQGEPGASVTGPAGVRGPAGVAGPMGEPGVVGPPGVDGQDGADGVDGSDGQDGADGVNGVDGQPGPPGPTCPDGTTLLTVTYDDGRTGLGCVSDVQPTPPPGEGTSGDPTD